jgi:uncharacterized membrane protein
MTDQLTYGGRVEGRTMPGVVYALYLLGIVNGLTVVLGLIMAYINRGAAGPLARSHYTFLIRTCWLWLAWVAIGVLLLAFGIPLSFVLVGIPLAALGWVILALDHIWFAVRVILGVIYLARDEPYPRPYSWLL